MGCGDVHRSDEIRIRDRALASFSRSCAAYRSKLAPIYRIIVRRDVIRRSSIAGLHANARFLSSDHSTAENATLRRVRRPTRASIYCCLLNALRNPLSDVRRSINDSIDSCEDCDGLRASLSRIRSGWAELACLIAFPLYLLLQSSRKRQV